MDNDIIVKITPVPTTPLHPQVWQRGENIGWTANIQNGNYDTMNSFSINFNY